MKPIEAINAHKLTLSNIEFIPFSKSRNKGEKHCNLNYKVTIAHKDRDILTIDYSMGQGHIPGFKFNDKSLDHLDRIKQICETGSYQDGLKIKRIQPKIEDVIFSVVMDSDVLNYSTFEDWAESFGYDTDSRQAEKIYRACIAEALALSNAVGSSGMSELSKTFQDF